MSMKYIPSRDCAKRPGPKNMPGFYYVEKDGKKVVVECQCHKEWREKIELSAKLQRANLWEVEYSPSEYKGTKSLEDVEMLKAYVEGFDQYKKNMIYAYGPNGTQKTTLAQWVGRELIKRGFSVYYTLMETLVTTLLPDFDKANEQRDEIIRRCLTSDLLIIDESFDLKSVTIYKSGYQIPYLYKFLKERFEIEGKGILFLSNIKVEDISQTFGTSFKDFISRNTGISQLSFLDNYVQTMETRLDPKGLFRK